MLPIVIIIISPPSPPTGRALSWLSDRPEPSQHPPGVGAAVGAGGRSPAGVSQSVAARGARRLEPGAGLLQRSQPAGPRAHRQPAGKDAPEGSRLQVPGQAGAEGGHRDCSGCLSLCLCVYLFVC